MPDSTPQPAPVPAPVQAPDSPPRLASEPIPWGLYFPLILVAGVVLIYAQTLNYPFIFDSVSNILHAKSIRSFPTWDMALMGNRRLMVLLSLAFNFSLSGLSPVSYHIFNIAIHLANTLLIYWVVLQCLAIPDRKPGNPSRLPLIAPDLRPLIAFVIAGFWAAHPVQVQSVTYTIQRAESMAALGLLGCAAAVLLHDRALSFGARFGAILLFALFGFIGVYSKEVALVLPLFIYLFDSRVVSGAWWAPFKARWSMYALSLALIALPLVSLKATVLPASPGATASAGFAQPYVTWYGYFLSQPRSILHYLWISVFPANLSLDLGWYTMAPGPLMALCFIPIVALFLWGLWLLVKRPWLGFVWIGVFFVVLAPSSSFMPIIDVAFEHRIYLPLLAVVITVVSLIWLGVQKLIANGSIPQDRLVRTFTMVSCALIVVLTARAYVRTLDFESQIRAWQAVTNVSPNNQRAWYGAAMAHVQAGLLNESLPYFAEASALEPTDPEPLAMVSLVQAKLGQPNLAVQAYDLGWPNAKLVKRSYAIFGDAAFAFGDLDRAKTAYIEALKFDPSNVNVHTNYGIVLSRQGDPQAALQQFQEAYDLAPDLFDQQINLAEAYQNVGQTDQAVKRYQEIIARFPTQPATFLRLSKLYMNAGDLPQAKQALAAGRAIAPTDPTLLTQLVLLSALSRDYKTLSAAQDMLLSMNPQNIALVHEKAWMLATCPDPAYRNPDLAIQLSQAIIKATGGKEIQPIQTLAAARAAKGEFDQAIKIMKEIVRARAVETKDTAALPQIDARIALFEAQKPYLDTTPFAGTPFEALDAKLNPPAATQPSTQPATQPAQ